MTNTVYCCGKARGSKVFLLRPSEGYIYAKARIREKCPVCGHFVLELERIDYEHRHSVLRLKGKRGRKAFCNIEEFIICELKFSDNVRGGSKFYLNYSEYGRKARCYSNLSSLKMGLLPDNFENFEEKKFRVGKYVSKK